jgi:hypothetical protein
VLAVLVEGEPELLDGRHNDLVRVVVGLEAADERRGVGIFLDAVLLEPVELLASLTVEVLAVDDEEARVDAIHRRHNTPSTVGAHRTIPQIRTHLRRRVAMSEPRHPLWVQTEPATPRTKSVYPAYWTRCACGGF